MNYDDLAGLDQRGKVVLLLSGAPSEIPDLCALTIRTPVGKH
jgi:hypothetical protein